MTSHHAPPPGADATGGWSPRSTGPNHTVPLAGGTPGPPRPVPGLAVAAILILVASAYVAVLASLLGRDLSLGVTRIDNVFFVWFTSATTGAALLGTAAASIRSRRLGTTAIALLGLHVLALVIILVVQVVITARLQYIVLTLATLLAVGLGLVAAVVGTVRAGQAPDPAPVGLVAGTVGVLVSSFSGPLAMLVSGHPGGVSPLLLQVLLVPGAISLIGYGARRRALPLLIMAAAALTLLVLLQIPQVISLARIQPTLVLGPVLRSLVVIGAILAVVMLVVSSRGTRPPDGGAPVPYRHADQYVRPGSVAPYPPQPGSGTASRPG